MATSTISALTAILAGNLDDTAVFAADDKNANTRKVTVAQLRTQLIAPAITFPSAITVSGLLTANGGIATVASGITSRNADGSSYIAKPLGDAYDGLFNWTMDDTYGYLLHFVTGPNAGGTGACIGIGVSYGGVGLLVHNYTSGNGIYLEQGSTITGTTAYGFYGRQFSHTAPLIHLDQNDATDLPLLSMWGSPTSSARIAEVYSDAGTTVAGYIKGTGSLYWRQPILLGNGTQGELRAYDDVGSAYRPLILNAAYTQFYESGAYVGAIASGGAISLNGSATFGAGFGCNGKAAQTPYASGGTLAGVVAALVANGVLSN